MHIVITMPLALAQEVPVIASSGNYTCAVVKGAAKCWGSGDRRLFGSAAGNAGSAMQVRDLTSGVTSIATGPLHACAVASGSVWCWGSNMYGQLGDGTNESRTTPIMVKGLPVGATMVTAGSNHTCALVDGDVYCWGSAKMLGQWYEPSNAPPYSAPAKISTLDKGITQIAAGTAHTCAVLHGNVWCWGLNNEGQLGNGSNTNSSVPVQIKDLVRVTSLSASQSRTCAIVDGEPHCWGSGLDGAFGKKLSESIATPWKIENLPSGFQSITTGGSHGCALASRKVWCWGDNSMGQLGRSWMLTTLFTIKATITRDSAIETAAVANEAGDNIVSIVAGDSHTCATYSDGAIRCWGDNSAGQLGMPSRSIIYFGRGGLFSALPLPVLGIN